MIKLIDRSNCDDHAALIEQVYRFRHRFFVEHLKWEACRKPDGREKDQFDGPDCIHLVGVDGGEVISYARLLPTTRPHLQSHVYPEILRGARAPTGPRIYEWTRCAAAPWKRDSSRALDPIAGYQFAAVVRGGRPARHRGPAGADPPDHRRAADHAGLAGGAARAALSV
ncbi:acyl-homoserine-lactone synthase [Methylobacterium nodulans]|uniref:acyl-homoserine-lactone synthase n=1 Tax=Methylobacterium nodulans TaxID=114616 RepID=UPI000A0212AF